MQQGMNLLGTSITEYMLSILPMYISMPVMVTENIDMSYGIVNGAEGIVRHINYIISLGGHKYAQCAYIEVKGYGMKCSGLPPNVVPIFPIKGSFTYNKEKINQEQLPLLPIFTYTDYKSQGHSLFEVIVDLADSHSLQSIYVMLLQVKSLSGLVILRKFGTASLVWPLSYKYRAEFQRLDDLAMQTESEYDTTHVL